MKSLYIVLVAIALAVGGYFAFFYKSCKEPSELVIAVQGLNCTLQILNKPPQVLREEFCQYLGRGADCDLAEEDRPKVIEMIDAQVLACAKARLEAEGYCTDKAEETLRSK